MKVNEQKLREYYESLETDELIRLSSTNTLTALASSVLKQVLQARGVTEEDLVSLLAADQWRVQQTSLELREVIFYQRLILWGVLTGFLGVFPPALIIVIPFQMYCAYKLARSLKLQVALIGISVILMLVPVISLLVLLALNQKAITVLRSAGIHVGLMGVRKEDLPPFSQES